MKKITFLFEDDYTGKKDTIKKEIDLDYQMGNTALADDGFQRILNSTAISFLSFLQKIDIDLVQFKDTFDMIYEEFSEDDDTDLLDDSDLDEDSDEEDLAEPETNLNVNNQLKYDEFLVQMTESEDFRKRMYQVYQLYFDN